jgi:hypothetical protein
MTEFATYDDVIIHTLRARAVRSAILIDDSFPSYQNLLSGEYDEAKLKRDFPDWKEAHDLYEFFHKHQIVCDVENRVRDIDDDFIEKVHKSDLVILDWNLVRGDDDNSEEAVRILKGLASTKHFNLVVVYTRMSNLASAWSRAAVHLRGGWQNKEDFFGSDVDSDELFEPFDDDFVVEHITEELLGRYVNGGWHGLEPGEKRALTDLISSRGVERAQCGRVAEALIHRAAVKRHGVKPGAGKPNRIEGSRYFACPYFTCGSVFVTFMCKPRVGEIPTLSIFDCLDSALKAWRPNLLQLLVSELQNELEQNSYAYDQALFPSEALKAGWLYHTLHTYAAGDGRPEALDSVVSALNSRLIEALDGTVSAQMGDSNSYLLTFGRAAARLALEGIDHKGSAAELVRTAVRLARVSNMPDEHVLHALNEYLSTDRFRGGHVTTGTVLCTEDKSQWFLCVSPACDMVPREPQDEMSWHKDLYPLRPLNLLKLEACNPGSALAEAERGVQIFITLDGARHYFRAVEGTTRLPRPMTCFLGNDEVAVPGEEKSWRRHPFQVFYVRKEGKGATADEYALFAVAQLRPAYAARFLHLTGHHQSRIGVDFINFSNKTKKRD